MKRLSCLLMLTLGAPLAVHAAEESPHSVTGNLTLASDYRFRGVSQTYEKPAIQGGFDYSHKSGIYLGTWASNVESGELAGSNMEWDFYGGYNWQINDDLSVNVGGLYYYYPGKDKAFYGFDPNTFEVYAGATWKWFNLKYSHTTTKLFGITDSKGSGYLEANVNVPLPADISLTLHYGKQFVAGDIAPGTSNDDYSDWKIGLSKEILGFNVGLAYVDTNIKSTNATWGGLTAYSLGSKTKDLTDGTAVLTIGKTF